MMNLLSELLDYYNVEFSTPLTLLILAYLIIMLIIVQIKKDSSIANFTWGGGCLLIAWYLYFVAHKTDMIPFFNRPLLLTLLVTLWCTRLAVYVYLRYRGDDPRYQSWKQQGLKALVFNLFWIFGLNTIMMLVMSAPILVVNSVIVNSAFTYLDWIGGALWIIGFYWESVSDYQMYKFTRNAANKGKIMKYGLWKYSRHPNYFGEVLMWWGVFFIALNISVVAIIAPLTITFLLLFVTGIPWVEKSMAKNPEYQEYKKHTSVFIPRFSK